MNKFLLFICLENVYNKKTSIIDVFEGNSKITSTILYDNIYYQPPNQLNIPANTIWKVQTNPIGINYICLTGKLYT